MRRKPDFFETIRQRAADRWDQLERDPELAGPWHQLFIQVQSPRHVLSELLQNADDAGAQEARVWIEDGIFWFEHDGEDFTEQHFASLCRFGYSNKRNLHTIGFRGIGFKSTFSLGDSVEIYTPSLAVRFNRQRFTEPIWLGTGPINDGKTLIRVPIKDENRRREIEKNLEEWELNPLSLLFFRNIRRLLIGKSEVCWKELRAGPVPNSRWMYIGDRIDQPYLLIQSDEEDFPKEAIEEIRQERMLSPDETVSFPPCRVEIVLGAKGLLYVILPAGVETNLPFACNTPFIQDPARLKIKDPANSPTNRWLLRRAGSLAADAMLAWLHSSELNDAERARAYDLMPDADHGSTLQGRCATIVKEAFEERIRSQPFVLTSSGTLVTSGNCVAFPRAITEIWPPEQAASIFDQAGRPVLFPEVSSKNRSKLINWSAVKEYSDDQVIRRLYACHPPKPADWSKLLKLWRYIDDKILWWSDTKTQLRIIPVEGERILYAANEVVRLASTQSLDSPSDWEFLSQYFRIVDNEWIQYIEESSSTSDENQNEIEVARRILNRLQLAQDTSISKVLKTIATKLFTTEAITIEDCVRFTQICAKFGADIKESLRYYTRDGNLRATTEPILIDRDGSLEELIPASDRDSLLLHPAYTKSFTSCKEDEWWAWALSERSGLFSAPPIRINDEQIDSREEIKQRLRERGVKGDFQFVYKRDNFVLKDWDFPEKYWQYWQALAKEDNTLWARLVDKILSQPQAYWESARTARAFQVSQQRHAEQITYEAILPSWIFRLRELPCLRDTRGSPHKPSDLYRRTPETECLMNLEPFIDAKLDTQATQRLLDLLGVNSTPVGPERLLDRLRALAQTQKPPIHEVERLYQRLDEMLSTSSTNARETVRRAFYNERLIFTNQNTWETSATVYLQADEEAVPGAPLIRESVRFLSLWQILGVAERPTVEMAIQWLEQLPKGVKLQSRDLNRARALLTRHPKPIWYQCRAWINLAGEWRAISDLKYAITMQSLLPWGHLHEGIKQRTADFQRLPIEVTSAPPFSELLPLAAVIEEQPQYEEAIGSVEHLPWLTTLGELIARIDREDPKEAEQLRALGTRLKETHWQTVRGLQTIPYIDGTPAGTPRQAPVVWHDKVLYVENLPTAKVARVVPEVIGSVLNSPDIKAALDYSFDRSPGQVKAYMEANFKLLPEEAVVANSPTPTARATDPMSEPPLVGVDGPLSATPVATSYGEEEDEHLTLGSAPAEEEEGLSQVRSSGRKSSEPPLMARFAASLGYKEDKYNQHRFIHEDGSWIARTQPGMAFPWERRNASGDIVRFYQPVGLLLGHDPIEIEAEQWMLLEKSPQLYALILKDAADNPIELTGTDLLKLRDQERLHIYPASYRLKLDPKRTGHAYS